MAEPDFTVGFPTLFVAADWAQNHCVIPDGFRKGEPWWFADWQAWCLLNFYRLRPNARIGQLATAFAFRRSQIVGPQKVGKAPYTAAHICVEGVGPALFAGWAEGGELWDCRDHGCGCGWVYEYLPGEGMGQRWPTPLIQVTATSEDQTDNIYAALRPMIDNGPLSALIPKTGEEFIRLPNDGRIDTVTSNALSRLGARVTFVPQDETGIWTKQNGMIKVAETQRRGLAGMGGRAEETTNGWDPTESSVAQRTAESKLKDIFRHHPLAPAKLKYRVKADRRKIHQHVYKGSPWVDLDAIEAESVELLQTDPAQAERFFGNRIVAGSDKAWPDPDVWKGLAKKGQTIEPGRLVTLGFDGSRRNDATALVATDIETGHQVVVGVWQRPEKLAEDAIDNWEVPEADVTDAVKTAFATWDVWRLYADPPWWENTIDTWAGTYRDKDDRDRVIRWWTNRPKAMAYALKAFTTGMTAGELSHDGDKLFAEHIGNAVRRSTRMRDPDTDEFLWTIGKDGPKSPNKIDIAMAACLSWEARGDAIAAGVLNKPTYGSASWR